MSEPSNFWYLENIDVTGIFCPQKIGRGEMDRHIHKVYKKGEYVFVPDDKADRIFFLTEGSVKIGTYGDAEAEKEIIKVILCKGEVFGEQSLIGEVKRRDFAVAMEDKTTICAVTVEEMRSLMRDHSALNLFLLKIMGSRMLRMEQRLESLVFKDSRSRVIEFLLQLAEKKGRKVGYELLVPRFMTHQEIANITATSRQTVTTILNELRSKDILTFNRRRLLIRDQKRLTAEMK